MMKLHHRDTLGLQDVVKIGGDLLLLPRHRLPNLSEALALQKAGVVDVNTSEIARNQMWRELFVSEGAYAEHRREHGREPAWMEDLPIAMRATLRAWYATTQEDPLAIVNELPHTGVSYMVLDDGLCEAVERVFSLRRLQSVNQLGFLQAPWVAMMDTPIVSPMSHTTRYLHSLDVMTLSSLIGENLGLSRAAFNTLRVAGFSHDRGMPAGGDSVQLVDPVAFNEDENYARLLREKTDPIAWNALRHEYDIDEQLLIDTVLNKGLTGKILDLADKLAYVARDITTALGVLIQPEDGDAYVGTRALQEIVDEFPYVCSVWDAVRREGDDLVFTDASRLIAFLKARIVLFRELYYHPRARFGEYLISRLLVKVLYEQGRLTRDALLEMGDSGLESFLDTTYGEVRIIRALSLKSRVETFKTKEDAVAFSQELARSGNRFFLVEDHLHAIKPGLHWLVEGTSGPKPLSEAYPGDARELHEMATMLPAVHVYYLDETEASKEKALVQVLEDLTPVPQP